MKRLCWILYCVSILALVACGDDDSSGSASGNVSVSLSTRAAISAPRIGGDIVLTRARFVIRDIKLETEGEPEGTEFETGPVLMELNLSGSLNEALVVGIPAGLYDEVRFKTHKLDDDDPVDQLALNDPVFADFAGPDRYSLIIEGSYDDGSGPREFVFNSDLNQEQRQQLIPPLVLQSGDSRANLTFVMDTTTWFVNGLGVTIDPALEVNRDQIEENIEMSIDLFEDDDEDGYEDGEDSG